MPLTSTDLANDALSKIMEDGGAGQSPDAEDTQLVKAAIPRMLAFLSAGPNSIYTVPDPEDIPEEAFDSLGLYLAGIVGTKYGKSEVEGRERRSLAVSELRRLNASGPTYEVMYTDYF